MAQMHYLNRRYMAHKNEFDQAIQSVLLSGRVVGGEWVERLEDELAAELDRKHVVLVGSGTDALYFALRSVNLKKGSLVFTTPYSFLASSTSILRCGATPIYADLDIETQLMMVPETNQLVDCQAILAVHMHGLMLQTEKFDFDLPVIEDAAQAWGSERGGIKGGCWGDVSILSFDPTKPITGFSSGGAVVTDCDRAAEMVRKLRNHGRALSQQSEVLGYNSQMSSMAAAFLSVSLNHWESWQARRKEIANYYLNNLNGNFMRFQKVTKDSIPNWHKFVIQVDHRNQVVEHLKAVGIETKINYARALYNEPSIATHVQVAMDQNLSIYQRVLSLPISPELSDSEVEEVVKQVNLAVSK